MGRKTLPPSSLTLVPAGLFLSLLSASCWCVHIFLSLFLKTLSQKCYHSLWWAGLWPARRPVLESPGMGFMGHKASFQKLLTEVPPVVPTTTKTWPCKPITQTHRPIYQSVASTISSHYLISVQVKTCTESLPNKKFVQSCGLGPFSQESQLC